MHIHLISNHQKFRKQVVHPFVYTCIHGMYAYFSVAVSSLPRMDTLFNAVTDKDEEKCTRICLLKITEHQNGLTPCTRTIYSS